MVCTLSGSDGEPLLASPMCILERRYKVMRKLLAFLALVVLFGAVLTPVSADEGDHSFADDSFADDVFTVVVGGPATIAKDTVLDIDALGPWDVLWEFGDNRYETAANVAKSFYGDETSEYVYVATGLNFPDALAGVPAAVVDGAPILLVTRTGIPAATAAALNELAPRVIYLIGGPAVVTPAVEAALDAYATDGVERVFGPTRYHTAAAVSQRFFPGETAGVYIATGENFPDALAAGPLAGFWEVPILLVQRDSIPAVTATELNRLNPEWIIVMGGSAAVSNTVVAQLAGYASDFLDVAAGANRYETAAMASGGTWNWAANPFVTTGENFPDALVAGAIAGQLGDPVLLTRKNSLPGVTAAELTRLLTAVP
jgi:putative cell wall-binding protein